MILLETPRLRLRRFTAADVDLLVELDSDPEVMRYVTGGLPTPREMYADTFLPRWFEIYAKQPLLGNRASQRVMEKCGLRRTGEFVYPPMLGLGASEDERRACKYEISRAEWLASRA